MGAGVAATALVSRKAQAQSAGDVAILNALLAAEYSAINTYAAGAGVIAGAPAIDPLYKYRGVVTAIAVHFQNQHRDHAEKLREFIIAQGGTPVADAGTDAVPTDFEPSIKNVIDLARNAEKAAAVAYTDVQKNISVQDNAALAAAIGSVESQHFVLF